MVLQHLQQQPGDAQQRDQLRRLRSVRERIQVELGLFLLFFHFCKKIGGHKFFLWGQYLCFVLLVLSPLGFEARCATLFMLCRRIHVTHSLRFTSGATPADLLVASIAAEPFRAPPMPARRHVEYIRPYN